MVNKTILWQHSFMPTEVKILYIHIWHFTCATIPVTIALGSAASLAPISLYIITVNKVIINLCVCFC